jgi:hypothetical protein
MWFKNDYQQSLKNITFITIKISLAKPYHHKPHECWKKIWQRMDFPKGKFGHCSRTKNSHLRFKWFWEINLIASLNRLLNTERRRAHLLH